LGWRPPATATWGQARPAGPRPGLVAGPRPLQEADEGAGGRPQGAEGPEEGAAPLVGGGTPPPNRTGSWWQVWQTGPRSTTNERHAGFRDTPSRVPAGGSRLPSAVCSSTGCRQRPA